MKYTLENDQCRVVVNRHGAELSSLVRKDLPEIADLEYIWPADPAVWGRHAPVLFPIVGRLPNDTYLHQGQEYTLSQHGFARDREFALVEQTEEALTFELQADEASRAAYPFEFVLRIRYQLRGLQLTVKWEVTNPAAAEELLFSIGAHPAFRCPLMPEEKFEDYFFHFDHPVTLERHLLQGGLLTGQTAPVLHEETEMPLTYELFAQDALVFKHFDFTHLTLRSFASDRAVRLRFDGFPFLGLWTKEKGAPFVCVEPWQGIAGAVGGPVELADKEGILTLRPGQTYAAEYSIAVV
ncbi:aldose 1-epimerase family protein [Hymenobacter chitinivorans]|uniref:Galactose mutarotase-like enzyme n=1 Tax=Hymenobacter chitinivorans DSM 11115 TaxID=1121954 RepID=A0A2M9BA15_9BACT|nr:aldose 1-epimerase family protein [Hymenobacter chitinivorans]PJJ54788.1 galactose mutarotase-like enzyme [Hymenobacter chitinivorans DSM 11115]